MSMLRRRIHAINTYLKGLMPPDYPDDPAERRRIKAFILGAGASCLSPQERLVIKTESPIAPSSDSTEPPPAESLPSSESDSEPKGS